MKIKTSQKSFLTLESVAMTDIVMNLFIFFFTSFSLLYTFKAHRETKIEVKLPEGVSKGAAKGAAPLIVSINAGNEIYIGKARVAPGAVKKELASRVNGRKSSGVLVRADKASSVDTLVRVLDASKEAGIEKLGVAMEQKD